MVNNLKQLLLIGFIAFGVAACSTTPKAPMAYNPNDSMAMNIAKAAGFGSQLKDTEVPADTLQKFTDSAAFGLGLAGAIAPIPGFSIGLLNIASWIFSPTPAAKRNSIVAWLPDKLAQDKDEAINHLSALLLSAAEKAGQDLNQSVETG